MSSEKFEQNKNQQTQSEMMQEKSPVAETALEVHEDVMPILQRISQNEQFQELSENSGAIQEGMNALTEYGETKDPETYRTAVEKIKSGLTKINSPRIVVTSADDARELDKQIQSLYEHLPETAEDHAYTVNAFRNAV